jgi:D-alanyl-D-alanine carboxypeptidase
MAAGATRARDGGIAGTAKASAERVLLAHGGLGASLALVLDGELVAAGGIGWRDPHRAAPVRPEDGFHLYSLGKGFVAAAAARLAERGALDLDAPVAPLLPERVLPGSVTLRRLLNHTAGAPDYGGLRAYHDAVRRSPDRPWSTEGFLDATLGRHPLAPAGRFAYSNIGYLLVRLAVERATGRPLGDVLEAEVFRPLGARHLRLATGLGDVHGLAPGWSTTIGDACAPVDVSRRYHPGWVSHGAVVGRAADAALALDGLMAGRLVGPASLDAMLEAVPVDGTHWLFGEPGYGLGLMIDRSRPAGRVAGHGGEGPGYSAGALCVAPGHGPRVTAVALANTESHDLGLRLASGLIAASTAAR